MVQVQRVGLVIVTSKQASRAKQKQASNASWYVPVLFHPCVPISGNLNVVEHQVVVCPVRAAHNSVELLVHSQAEVDAVVERH